MVFNQVNTVGEFSRIHTHIAIATVYTYNLLCADLALYGKLFDSTCANFIKVGCVV